MSKNIFISFSAALLLSACATTSSERMFEVKEYFRSYMDADTGSGSKSRAAVSKKIRDMIGGNDALFYSQAERYISTHARADENRLTEYARTLRDASAHGLLSESQVEKLKGAAQEQAEGYLLEGRTFDERKLRTEYPSFGSSNTLNLVANKRLASLQANPSASLEEYIPVAKYFKKAGNSSALATAIEGMRPKIAGKLQALVAETPEFARDIYPMLEYIETTGDRSFDGQVISALSKAKLSKVHVDDPLLTTLYPKFQSDQRSARRLSLGVFSDGNDSLAGEISDELKKLNEWVELDESPKIRINLNRLRLSENRPNPSNLTETVSDPSFGTLLFIPKNASVHFDYTKEEYSVRWSTTAVDQRNKRSKAISGEQRAIKVTCRNIRFQNVFGGTGAIPGYPNDRVQRFCTDNSSTDFEAIRAQAIKEIASQINSEYLN